MSIAEKKVKIIQTVASTFDEEFVDKLLKDIEGNRAYAGETDTARQHFEEFNQQYSNVLKRLAE